jgi:hypothetical protein
VDEIRPLLREKPPDPEYRKRERLLARPSLDELFTNVTDKAARDERIHEAVRVHCYTLNEVGEHVGLLYSTVSVIAKRLDGGGLELYSDPFPQFSPLAERVEAKHSHFSRIWHPQALQALAQGGFSGPVGAHQPENLPFCNLKAHLEHRHELPVPFRQLPRLNHKVHGSLPFP